MLTGTVGALDASHDTRRGGALRRAMMKIASLVHVVTESLLDLCPMREMLMSSDDFTADTAIRAAIREAITSAVKGYTYDTWVDYDEAVDNVMAVMEAMRV